MARTEWIELGPTPANEPCQQFGPNYDRDKARWEARLHVWQVRKQFSQYDKVRIKLKTYYEDYTNYSVAIGFNPDDDESIRQAFDIESNCYSNWTSESKKLLKYHSIP